MYLEQVALLKELIKFYLITQGSGIIGSGEGYRGGKKTYSNVTIYTFVIWDHVYVCHLKNMRNVKNKYNPTSCNTIYQVHDQTKNKIKLLDKILKNRTKNPLEHIYQLEEKKKALIRD